MLIYDTRYRSMTIQIVVLFLFMAGAAWLVDNTIKNLATLGKDFSFDFLWNRAGYDINQVLVEYIVVPNIDVTEDRHLGPLFVFCINRIKHRHDLPEHRFLEALLQE